MQHNRVRPMVEGGILAAVAILFALISVYVPFIGVFVNLIWPVPIILLGVRNGYKWSIMATVVAGVLIAILLGPLHAVGVAIGFGLIGITLGHAFRKNYSPVKSLICGSIASLISKAIVLSISAVVLGINPLNDQSEMMSKAVEQAIGLYRTFGMKEQDLQQIAETMRNVLDIMKYIIPAGFIMASVVDTFLNYQVSKSVLRKLGTFIQPFPEFKNWSLPTYVLYLFILSIAMLYWGKSREIEPLVYVGMNIQILCTMLLALQGLSLVYFLADKYNVSKFLRWLFIIFVFTNGFFMQIAMFAGAFDMAIDYRKLRKPANPA